MKPKIICHIFSSVDGRLLNERWTRPYDGKAPGEICGVYAEVGKELRTQAWMFGKNTLQQLYFPEVFIHAEKDETRDVTTY